MRHIVDASAPMAGYQARMIRPPAWKAYVFHQTMQGMVMISIRPSGVSRCCCLLLLSGMPALWPQADMARNVIATLPPGHPVASLPGRPTPIAKTGYRLARVFEEYRAHARG